MPIPQEIIDRVLSTKHGEAAYLVVERMMDAGHECWWIGGAVRDMALGIMPTEIDMASSARPEEIAALFKKSDESAASLGTVIISVKGEHFEVTTFREDDAASDGRHPESVRFGTDREKDSARRDATVNAMYWNPITRELFDPFGGEKDLGEHLVRFIGDPAERVQHDALRILRLVRLRATIDGQYDPQTYAALRNHAALTGILSGTRILEELEKLLKTRLPQVGLEDWWELGLMKELLPELYACKGVAQPVEYHKEGDVWNHLLRCTASFTDDHEADVRLAALFHDTGKAVTFEHKERIRFDHHAQASAEIIGSVFTRLRMPGIRIKKLQWIVEHHMMMDTFGKLTDERKAHWYFHPWFRELLQLFWLDIAGTIPGDSRLYDSIINDYNRFLNAHPRPEKSLLNGEEIMTLLGIQPGEKVGEVLQALDEAHIRKDITTKKEAKEFLLKKFSDT